MPVLVWKLVMVQHVVQHVLARIPWRNGCTCTSATVRRVASLPAAMPPGTHRTREMYLAPVVLWLHETVIGVRISPDVNDRPDAHSAPLLHAVVLER